nr:hypothetical protein [Propionibacterium sp.]
MTRARRLAALAVGLGLAAAGCTQGVPAGSPTTPLAPSASVTTPAVDLTAPGVAQRVVRELVAASGSSQVLIVDIRPHEASVSVLVGDEPHTWAFRDGAIKEVPSDLAFVDQVAFDPERFNLSDVGALFRTAAELAGSAEGQRLQIVDLQRVDHSAADVKMTVSTNPETRTVFFNADGTLVPTLDFHTAAGIAAGLADARGDHTAATTVAVGSDVGAYVEFPGPDGDTIVRRQRAARFPVTASPRAGDDTLALFDPRLVDAAAIWRVLQRYAAVGSFGPTTAWSVVVDQRGGVAAPRMHFTVGGARSVTDLAGNPVS